MTALLGIVCVYHFGTNAIQSLWVTLSAHFFHPQLIAYTCATIGAFTVVKFAWKKFLYALDVLDVCNLFGEKDAERYMKPNRYDKKAG
ncbi:MAG: hypothetical protein A2845_02760 [Candidatus Lloydbacteria bacterium RIFCSPHIGHO2_01_FULL_49_22]|uniref:Uncharacterized protein n=1 Tax=Candidatus Lloydbacteria bacterium RIFCSPHIGHO2_01_FULL_49_22 TaxID=1798658 RepID=A0A1G2CVD1_9BACT|nr:MAG: hypothetical protein A2845_02760 [Candidatus Lloydbacteria bacterium RIFCSPHIGHO2_01_FULL_49_22]OGZ10369.1 MAG: hypothetical protein A3C14_02460 [Candidatus Lloydbacteria bacterium RIFCSPHIGHO2_02_FULL_50_18]